MRVALISDLHANLVALDAVLADIARVGHDRIVCLGDVATLGPEPNAIFERLDQLGCLTVLGNHDEFLLDDRLIHTYTEAPVVVQAVEWCRARTTAAELDFVRRFQTTAELALSDRVTLFLFHGSPRSHMENLLATTPQAGAWTPSTLSAQQFETVGLLVELVIPTTETPGAKAALVDRYIDGVLQAANPATRDRFLAGLDWLDTRSTTLTGTTFRSATTSQQINLLTRLATEPSGEEATGVQFFTAVKSMTITGYYTTEVGLRQELGDSPVMMLPSYPGCTHPEHQ